MDSKITFKSDAICKVPLSILIISPQKYFKNLGCALKIQAKDKFDLPIEVSSAELIKDVTDKLNYSLFDGIIVAVDTTKETFSAELIATLMGISCDYLVSRTFLVNANCGSCNFESALEFKRIANKFKINYINSDVEDKESCNYLVKRLANLMDIVLGVSSGKPLVLPTASILSSIDEF